MAEYEAEEGEWRDEFQDNPSRGPSGKVLSKDRCVECNQDILTGEHILCDRCYASALEGKSSDNQGMYYVEDQYGKPVQANMWAWARMFELDGKQLTMPSQRTSRVLAFDSVGFSDVSTVFLGINHGISTVEPLLYETLVLGGPLDGYQDRYTTRPQALDGHGTIVCKVIMSQTWFQRGLGAFVRWLSRLGKGGGKRTPNGHHRQKEGGQT